MKILKRLHFYFHLVNYVKILYSGVDYCRYFLFKDYQKEFKEKMNKLKGRLKYRLLYIIYSINILL